MESSVENSCLHIFSLSMSAQEISYLFFRKHASFDPHQNVPFPQSFFLKTSYILIIMVVYYAVEDRVAFCVTWSLSFR